MDIRNLTLDQVYDLEAAGSLSVGSRSAVFLEPRERAPRQAPVGPFAAAADQARGKLTKSRSELQELRRELFAKRAQVVEMEAASAAAKSIVVQHFSPLRKFQSSAAAFKVDEAGHVYAPIGKVKSAAFSVGDTVRVHTKVLDGDKERIQIFSGVVIGRRGHGLNETFTVSRLSYGKRVQRIFPVHSPRIDKIEIAQNRDVRRHPLAYLRKRLGKRAHPKAASQVHRDGTKFA